MQNQPTVLVVDDHPANILAMEAILSGLKCQVVAAGSADDALRAVMSIPPGRLALMLLDVMLPGVNGVELLGMMRKSAALRDVPAIVVTARDMDRELMQAAYINGAVDYILKPFDFVVLQAKIRTFLSLHEQRERLLQEADARRALEIDLATQRALQQTRERMLGIVGHDLRMPLAAIIGSAQLLRASGAVLERGLAPLERIERGAQRMGRMIAQLTDFTRIRLGSGKLTLRRTELDVVSLCREVVDELSAGYPNREICFASDVSSCSGHWDRDRIFEVISNLVANALNYGARDSKVTVSFQEEAEHCVISVHNVGEPIPPGTIGTLFDPFVQGPSSDTARRNAESLGLGLFIVREIIRAHRGTIEAASSADHGTTFSAKLPKLQAPESEIAAAY
jgi:signal transduction histidine kinase